MHLVGWRSVGWQAPSSDFGLVFDRLRQIMLPYGDQLVVVRDEPGDYYVNAPWSRADGYVLMFGAVQTRARWTRHCSPSWPR